MVGHRQVGDIRCGPSHLGLTSVTSRCVGKLYIARDADVAGFSVRGVGAGFSPEATRHVLPT